MIFRVIAWDGLVLDEFDTCELASYNPAAGDPECAGKVWQEADIWGYLASRRDREQRPEVYA